MVNSGLSVLTVNSTNNCIPEKRKYYGSCTVIVRTCICRDVCVQPTSHISFGISFNLCKWLAMAQIWPPYYFGSPGVKIMLWGVKTSNILTNFDYCLCSSCTAQFPSDFILYLVHVLVGMTSHHPIFFVGLGSKSSE